ncbi:glycosyltransferase [Aestuariibius sp. 2305UL40-4]|uniref:glycosyltransferase n=1 Tax=Aestuariibius violaceus TaxID=3234132 RepID=UPI00345E2FDC
MSTPHVTILLATYQGARWLPEQLASFQAQTHEAWSVVASDDGSTDGTRELLEGWGARMTLRDGPRQGAAANFLSLVKGLPEAPGWIAFSDQDDAWLPEKLARGVAALGPGDEPALHCSSVAIADEGLSVVGRTLRTTRPLAFRNALVQNVVTGCTVLLNPAGAALLRAAAQATETVFIHDWWTYLVLSGAGARIVREEEPGVLYRQHGGNAMGAHAGMQARLARAGILLSGRYRAWTDLNLAALQAIPEVLTPENAALVDRFAEMRQAPLRNRMRLLRELGLYRQTRAGNAALWLAVALGRI